MADSPKIQSPEWWLLRLLARLEAERPKLDLYDRYYWGDHPLAEIPPDLHKKYLTQFETLHRQSRANFMSVVVDAKANRLKVNGFRLSSTDDKAADQETWRIWQGSGMDAQSKLALRSALVKGRAYLSVWTGDEFPRIAFEDACQTIVEYEPGNRRVRAAALKTWVDDWTGEDRANVHLPAGIHKFKRIREAEVPKKQIVPAVVPGDGNAKPPEWVELTDEFVPNPLNRVTVFELTPRPDDYWRGRSVLEGVTDIQDRMNGFIFNQVLAGWFAAFVQKWATGVDIPVDPETGQPIEPWSQAITRMFISEDPEAKFGSFPATDLTPYIASREQEAKDIATISATPRHFLIQQGQEPSGDALDSAEAPLIATVRNIHDYVSDDLEEVLRAARLFAGESETPVDSEIVWADPRDPAVIEAARTDAIIKRHAEGLVSTAMAQEQLGYTPQQIERMSKDIVKESLARRAVDLDGLVTSGSRPGVQQPAS